MSTITKVLSLERRVVTKCLYNRLFMSHCSACNRHLVSTLRSPLLHSNSSVQPSFHSCNHFIAQRFFLADAMSVEDIQKAIQQHLSDGDVVTADQALIRLEQQQDDEKIDVNLYTAVMDAWIEHQKNVQDGPHRVHQEFEAADRAHAILDKLQRISDKPVVTRHHYEQVLGAWWQVTQTMLELDTPLRGIPQRAQVVLQQFQQQASEESDLEPPTINDYNTVLEMWGNSPEHLRATMAENLFQQLSRNNLQPTNETFLIMIRAWCRSKQDRAAFNATGHLMKMHRLMSKGVDGISITLDDYKTILKAWTRAADKLAPQKAFWVIKLMQKAYIDRVSDVRPDEECYRYVLQTYARSTLPNLGDDVDELMEQMEDRLLTPDSECFTYAIQTWRNCATNYFNEGTQHEDAMHASKLLVSMEKAHHRSSNVEVQPTTQNYNDVMKAWSTSSKAGAAIHAESLLKKLEKAYTEEGIVNLKPNADSYRWALEAWANSPSQDKLNHAVTILSRMKDLTEGSEGDHAKPTVGVFNAFIHVCGASDQGRHSDKKYNLKLAVNTVEEMRKREEAPNSATFRLLLEACENLLPMGKERSRAAENIFKNCCYLGLVDDEVLSQFRSTVPDDVFTDLVVANSTEDAADGNKSSKMVPQEWTRNVGVKVMTVDGKKPKPLNIDGMFVVTKRVKEFRVKRLRQHKNMRLLRSGRSLYVKNSRMAKSL